MVKFYFNECIISNNINEFTDSLVNSILHFKILKEEFSNIEYALITEKLPSLISFGQFSLQDSILKIQDRNIKTLAFSYFNKYPLEGYISINEEQLNHLIENDFKLYIDTMKFNATNLAIVSLSDNFLFTVPTHIDYKKNLLEIKSHSETKTICNLFGSIENNKFISIKIESVFTSKIDIKSKLKTMLGDCVFSNQFEKEFNQLSILEKESIFTYFKKAIDRNLKTPFYPDTKIVSDVTPNPNKFNCNVMELRVYTPSALRVYFNETKGVIYLCSIGFKNEDSQNEDIKKAYLSINRFLLTKI